MVNLRIRFCTDIGIVCCVLVGLALQLRFPGYHTVCILSLGLLPEGTVCGSIQSDIVQCCRACIRSARVGVARVFRGVSVWLAVVLSVVVVVMVLWPTEGRCWLCWTTYSNLQHTPTHIRC